MGESAKTFYEYFPTTDRDRKWGLYITTVGESLIGPEQPYPPRGHPTGYDFEWRQGRVLSDHQVVYISRGRGTFESEQIARRQIESGDVMLIFPGVWHRYRPDPETGWAEHWVGFDGEVGRSWVREGFFAPSNPVLRPGREELLLATFSGMIEAIKSKPPALQQILAGSASQVLGWLYSAQQARLAGDDRGILRIQKAIVRMQAELATNLNLPELARELKVSYSSFRRTFVEHTGSSPHQYLIELRLAHARNLLSATTQTVKEIARQSGFEDEHYFCRVFKERNGCTPTRWRGRGRRRKRKV